MVGGKEREYQDEAGKELVKMMGGLGMVLLNTYYEAGKTFHKGGKFGGGGRGRGRTQGHCHPQSGGQGIHKMFIAPGSNQVTHVSPRVIVAEVDAIPKQDSLQHTRRMGEQEQWRVTFQNGVAFRRSADLKDKGRTHPR